MWTNLIFIVLNLFCPHPNAPLFWWNILISCCQNQLRTRFTDLHLFSCLGESKESHSENRKINIESLWNVHCTHLETYKNISLITEMYKKVFAKLHFWNYARCSGSPFHWHTIAKYTPRQPWKYRKIFAVFNFVLKCKVKCTKKTSILTGYTSFKLMRMITQLS